MERQGPREISQRQDLGAREARARLGGFAETHKRLLIAFGKPGAVEPPTARARRLAQAGARKAEGKERAAAKRRRGRRKRR